MEAQLDLLIVQITEMIHIILLCFELEKAIVLAGHVVNIMSFPILSVKVSKSV